MNVVIVSRNKAIHGSKYNLFENRDEQLSESDICSCLNEGRLFLAKHAREKGLYTEALKLLSHVHTAEASFQIALVYLLVNHQLKYNAEAILASCMIIANITNKHKYNDHAVYEYKNFA